MQSLLNFGKCIAFYKGYDIIKNTVVRCRKLSLLREFQRMAESKLNR